MTELQKIENEIAALKRKAARMRLDIVPIHFDFNNKSVIDLRSKGLRLTTHKKREPKIKKSKLKFMTQKFTFETPKATRVLAAANWAGVEIVGAPEVINGKKSAAILRFPGIESIAEMGGYMETMTDADVKAVLEKIAKAKADQEAKEKAKAASVKK